MTVRWLASIQAVGWQRVSLPARTGLDAPSTPRQTLSMNTWLLQRLVQAMFVILAVTIIVFLGVHLIGNPADILIPPGADQAETGTFHRRLGTGPAASGGNTWFSFNRRCMAAWAKASSTPNQPCG